MDECWARNLIPKDVLDAVDQSLAMALRNHDQAVRSGNVDRIDAAKLDLASAAHRRMLLMSPRHRFTLDGAEPSLLVGGRSDSSGAAALAAATPIDSPLLRP